MSIEVLRIIRNPQELQGNCGLVDTLRG
ncbi:protein of unknown function [Methanoculleus bourgensis]|uniref:Uncharacterized protein n=1 Tax=Methanoculleus bourgensis TaxID=83986 RepID=A0A0X3BQ44_9EURY|nr:protein of unknown function [Methanoculleus bourgensis]